MRGSDSSRIRRSIASSAQNSASAPTGKPRKNTSLRITAIDGLRALAIIGVIAYHMRPKAMQGGFLGVTLFFVASGFFITRSMLHAYARGGFNYVQYLRKRLSRLWPPVLATIGIVAFLAYLFSPFLISKEVTDAAPSALFYSNWWFIFRKQSYFAASGLPSPLTHLWYTSLIMQFYLLWPFVFAFLIGRWRKREQRMTAVAVLVLVSTIEMAILYLTAHDTSRVYYGLDTRAAELLVGALLALLLTGRLRTTESSHKPASHTTSAQRTANAERARDGVGFLALAILVVCFFTVNDQASWLYCGGFLVCALLAAFLLWMACLPGLFSRFLSVKPLQYLGSRSFSLYLVHYPLLEIMNPATRMRNPSWWEWILQILVILVVGELFYQLVEALRGTPWLPWMKPANGGAKRAKRGPSRKAQPRGRQRPGAVTLACIGVIVTISMVLVPSAWASAAERRSIQLRPELAHSAPAKSAPSKQQDEKKSEKKQQGDSGTEQQASVKPEALKVPETLDPSQYKCDYANKVCSAKLLIIGDSVMAASQEQVQPHFPEARINAATSRHFWAAPGEYKTDIATYDPQVIFIALNINGPVYPQSMDEIYGLIGTEKPVYFMTGRAPSEWVQSNNDFVIKFAREHKNVGVIDWAGLTGDHPEYLIDDGTHPTPQGAEAFADLIFKALCGSQPAGNTGGAQGNEQQSNHAHSTNAKLQALKVPENLDPSKFHCDYAARKCDARLLSIGDSVLRAANPFVMQRFPQGVVDMDVGRSFAGALERYPIDTKDYDPQVVFIELNVNGPIAPETVEQVYDMIGKDKPIYFMLGVAPVSWLDANNALLRDFANSHANVGLIDWPAYLAAHPEYLGEDGMHPIPLGAEGLADMVLDAVCGKQG